MDNRDFRVRAHLHIESEGRAKGLYNHAYNKIPLAVDINPGSPNAEMRRVEIEGTWEVRFDLCFPIEEQVEAEGLYQHTENVARQHATPASDENPGFVKIHRCGHRSKQSCTPIDYYKVEA